MAETEVESKKKRGKGKICIKILFLVNFFLLSEKTIFLMRMLAKGGMKGKFQISIKGIDRNLFREKCFFSLSI